MRKVKNPYLDEVSAPHSGVDVTGRHGGMPFASLARLIDGRGRREGLVRRYAWAIPNDAAIRELVAHSPLVEVGAGNGYWAWLVEQAGGDIVAYDLKPWPTTWTRVRKGTTSAVRRHPGRTLFLCWPPYDSAMAACALRAYAGRKLVYVGEEDGCTADDTFRAALARDWRLLRTVRIPQWDGLYDRMFIFRRKQGGARVPRA